ncbi:hypothetical protein EBB_03640 [Methylomonas sp. EbB]|uniref:Uncharacterized protein n=1 Tax=Methylomonas fluvii TaxID=1854564 RepID=A0ABR9D972_9GAMM|nr:hypothetical protein [Methylomonas fluvii]
MAGSTYPEALPRKKTKRILETKPALRELIEQSRSEVGGRTTHEPIRDRVVSVLTKLAKGHALYELHESCTHDPDELEFGPLKLMSPQQREFFETPEFSSCWPEIGSRAMQRLLVQGANTFALGWIEVQSDRYRYLASLGNGIEVRIVIDEYLACFARWE